RSVALLPLRRTSPSSAVGDPVEMASAALPPCPCASSSGPSPRRNTEPTAVIPAASCCNSLRCARASLSACSSPSLKNQDASSSNAASSASASSATPPSLRPRSLPSATFLPLPSLMSPSLSLRL
ncbi:hypothetical protein Vafri_8834, partial [Volvox africanus]